MKKGDLTMPREATAYKFGESAVMPEGKPFVLSIEGVDTKFELVHHLDAAGNIHMSVDRADHRRRPMQHDARPHVTHAVHDEDAYDPRTGLLRDGHAIRVPMREMRDSNAPLIINTRGIDWGRDDFNRDGTLKRRNHRDDDTQSRRRRMQARDPQGRETGSEEETDDHRPGFRDADRSASETARAQLINDTANAWRGPQSISQPEKQISDAAPPAGVSASEWARHQRMLQDAEAWRTPPVLDANGPEVAATTRAITEPPKGAWGPAGFAAKAGDPCTENGAPGRLREKDGWLYCDLTPVGPSRSSETVNPGDRATMVGDRSAQDAAWMEMVRSQNEAWKTPA
jgi:hypothetical protein